MVDGNYHFGSYNRPSLAIHGRYGGQRWVSEAVFGHRYDHLYRRDNGSVFPTERAGLFRDDRVHHRECCLRNGERLL